MEKVEHLPREEDDRNHDNRDGQNFTKVHAGAARFEPTCYQAQNVQGGKPENQHPQDVVNVALLIGEVIGGLNGKQQRWQGHQSR